MKFLRNHGSCGVLDTSGGEYALTGYRNANQLVSHGYAKIESNKPFVIRLLSDKIPSCYESRIRKDAIPIRPIFQNCKILTPRGDLLCMSQEEKTKWYVSRGLADLISSDPMVVKLKFEPAGPGHQLKPFHLTVKENKCIVCGFDKFLGRHHIIPHVFRRWIPLKLNRYDIHDILPVCFECHEAYERHADKLRESYLIKYNVSVPKYQFHEDRNMSKSISYAKVLLDHHSKIPEHKKNAMLSFIEKTTNKKNITKFDLIEIKKLNRKKKDEGGFDMGREVMKNITDINSFCREWREHFVAIMQPRFMPEGWTVDYELMEEAVQ